MTEKTLTILRGVSGSGKTTLARVLEQSLPDCKAIAADDFWYVIGEGEYAFDINRLGEAHAWCKERVLNGMNYNTENIVLHNTNTSEKEINPYLELAKTYGYKVVSLVVENRHGNSNVHSVPDNVLCTQERKLRNAIKLC